MLLNLCTSSSGLCSSTHTKACQIIGNTILKLRKQQQPKLNRPKSSLSWEFGARRNSWRIRCQQQPFQAAKQTKRVATKRPGKLWGHSGAPAAARCPLSRASHGGGGQSGKLSPAARRSLSAQGCALAACTENSVCISKQQTHRIFRVAEQKSKVRRREPTAPLARNLRAE